MYNPALARYKLGLGALAVVVLVLTMYVVLQGIGARQDTSTETKAHAIASKLKDYTNAKYVAPASLDVAGAKDVPATISYQKKSDTSYEFCATYKAASDNLTATGLQDVVSGTPLAAYTGAAASTNAFNPYGSSGGSNPSTLAIGQHKKGKNCQTVTLDQNFLSPGLNNGLGTGSGSSSGTGSGSSTGTPGTCTYDYTKTEAENNAYFACVDAQNPPQSH